MTEFNKIKQGSVYMLAELKIIVSKNHKEKNPP